MQQFQTEDLVRLSPYAFSKATRDSYGVMVVLSTVPGLAGLQQYWLRSEKMGLCLVLETHLELVSYKSFKYTLELSVYPCVNKF